MTRARLGVAQSGQGWEVENLQGCGSPEPERGPDTPEGVDI